jgi:predicted nucleic acid-binding protein
MTVLVFVDTNVFIYARDAGEPPKQTRAAAWLAYLWREQTGRTSAQVLSEYYVNVTRKLTPGLTADEAWDDLMALFTWQPQPNDAALLQRGRDVEQRHRISWWDSLIVGAAQLQGCDLLLTEDLQDGGVYGGVTVRNPFTFALGEATPSYRGAPTAAVRHRPRGRAKG